MCLCVGMQAAAAMADHFEVLPPVEGNSGSALHLPLHDDIPGALADSKVGQLPRLQCLDASQIHAVFEL